MDIGNGSNGGSSEQGFFSLVRNETYEIYDTILPHLPLHEVTYLVRGRVQLEYPRCNFWGVLQICSYKEEVPGMVQGWGEYLYLT